MNYLPRAIEQEICAALEDTPVIVITGPRQAGKTTLIRHLLPENISYLTLDDDNTLLLAKNDPIGLLRSLPRPIAIDEIQRAPELIRTIKLLVDEKRSPGSFILTGSADLMTVPKLADSLAGRAEFITLYPFSQAELMGGKGNFLEALFANQFNPGLPVIEQGELIDKVVSGGYPEVLNRAPNRRSRWHLAYEHAIVQRDIKEVFQLQKMAELDKLTRLLAVISSETLNINSLAGPAGLDNKSVSKYITALEHLYIVKQIPAWHSNELKRAIKSPKLHFIDTGLLCALRDLTAAKLLKDRNLLGNIIETFVGSELLKLIATTMQGHQLYHYRDKDKKEVDFIVTARDGSAVGLEVKAGMSIKHNMFAPMQSLINAGVISHGIIVYTGDKLLPYSPQLTAVPVTALFA